MEGNTEEFEEMGPFEWEKFSHPGIYFLRREGSRDRSWVETVFGSGLTHVECCEDLFGRDG